MRPWRLTEEDLLVPSSIQWVILDENSRTKARNCRCGEGPYLCRNCAFTGGIISKDLALRLQDSDFALTAPLTLQQARRWTPPGLPSSGERASFRLRLR
jgi:hypothetical protein